MVSEAKRAWYRWVPLGVLGMLVLTSLACISGSHEVQGFNLGRDYELQSGDQLTGDQVIMAYTIRFQADSAVDGDVTLTANTVDFDGSVTGDLVVVADRFTLGNQAAIMGDLAICVKTLERSPGARVDGEVREECDSSSRVSVSNVIRSGWDSWRSGWFYRASSAVMGSFLFGALAALGTVFFPRPLVRMSETMRRAPFSTGGFGCLTMLVAIGLTGVYVISLLLVLPLVLLPFVALAWLVIGLLSLLGWMALAEPFGILVVRVLHIGRQPRMISAAIGGITLGILLRIWSVFWFTAWIGILATIVLGSIGLGAVLLTHVGTQPYPRSKPGHTFS